MRVRRVIGAALAVGLAAGCGDAAPTVVSGGNEPDASVALDAGSDLVSPRDVGSSEDARADESHSSDVASAVDAPAEVLPDAPAERSVDDASSSDGPPGYVKGIVGVGYGGIRIVSRDQGKTWGSRAAFAADGVDDENLLRAVVYGKGLWIATGWKLVTSPDGVHWTDHGLITKLPDPRPSCNIIEGLAFKEPTFYAACSGTLFRSDDGLKWTSVAAIGDTGGHLFLTYRAGQFVAYGDTMTSFRSTDGAAWSVMSGVEQATFCEGQFKSQSDCGDASWFDGVYLKPEWKSKVLRSTDGAKFSQAYVDDMQNTLYQGRAFAEGYVSP